MKKMNDLEFYVMAEEMADTIWNICIKWEFFSKNVIGQQLCRAADSICSNISEGFGRHYYKENLRFLYYARGSLEETRNWLIRAQVRKLIDSNLFSELMDKIELIGKRLNACINGIKKQIKN